MGNKNQKGLEYNDFLKLLKQQNEQEINSQQHLLHQYQCRIVNHKNKSIEGICMNEFCKQENRRACLDCINDRIHDTDIGKVPLIKNADQSENIIMQFKCILNEQMDRFQFMFQFFFEQFEFCDIIDDNYFEELIKIYQEFLQTQSQIDKLDLKQYLLQLELKNVGLFQYLLDYQKLISILKIKLNRYKQMRNDIKKQAKRFLEVQDKVQIMYSISKRNPYLFKPIQDKNYFKKVIKLNEQKQIKNDIKKQPKRFLEVQDKVQIMYSISKKNPYLFKPIQDKNYIQIVKNQIQTKSHIIQRADWVWPEGRINYLINSSLTLEMKQKLNQAIQHIEKFTPIQFHLVIHPDGLSEYVVFYKSLNDASYTIGCGRRINGGEHQAYLSEYQPMGSYIHEIMHILGFEHEQCRRDRDQMVTVHEANIVGNNIKQQYKKKKLGYMLGQYDVNSIMHYRLQKDIMEQQGQNANQNIGQREQLSQGDIKGIQYVYGNFNCTYDVFPEEYYAQSFYECLECCQNGSPYEVCELCAHICHEGHELIFHELQENIKLICVCGRHKHQLGMCTRERMQDAIVYYKRGLTLSDELRKEDAIEEFTKAIEIDPYYAAAYWSRGLNLRDIGRKENAIEDFTNAIAVDPQYAAAYYHRGLTFSDMGRSKVAEEDVKEKDQILISIPQNENNDREFKNIDFINALEDYNQAIRINPKFAEAYFNRGLLLSDLEKQEDAIKDHSKAIEFDPNQAKFYGNRGFIFSSLRLQQEAQKDYNIAKQIDPQCASEFYNSGNQLRDLRRYRDALKEYTKAIEINPQFSEGYHNRGFILSVFGKKEDAIKDYTSAIKINPQNAEAYHNRGYIFSSLDRYQEAINDYNEAIEINPQLAQAYYSRGIANSFLGKQENVYTDLLKAFSIQPQNPLFNVELGRYNLSDGEKLYAYDYFFNALKNIETLTKQDQTHYNLSDLNVNYLQKYVKSIKKIEENLLQVEQIVKSKILSQNQQDLLQESIKLIEIKFRNKIIQPFDKEDRNTKNELKEINQQLKDALSDYEKISQRRFSLQYFKRFRIKRELMKLEQDKNKLIYYQSLYWRLCNYLSACYYISTEQKRNPYALIDYNSEIFASITTQIVQQISNISGTIPIVPSVITLISSTLEFVLNRHLNYTFNQIVKKLAQIVSVRCTSRNEINEQIQLAIIEQSKQLSEIKQNLLSEQHGLLFNIKQIWTTAYQEGLIINLKQIQEIEINSGYEQAQDPYWKLGIVDTLKVLHYLLLDQQQIKKDDIKELHLIILDSLKENTVNSVGPSQSLGQGCSKCCQIQ